MPHLTLEYTSNLPPEVASRKLFGRLHRILADVGGIDIRNCKSRAIELRNFLVGDAAGDEGYVHLDVRFLEGRPREVKVEIGRRILEALRDAYEASERAIQVTVEVGDIAKDFYFKYPEGTIGRGPGAA